MSTLPVLVVFDFQVQESFLRELVLLFSENLGTISTILTKQDLEDNNTSARIGLFLKHLEQEQPWIKCAFLNNIPSADNKDLLKVFGDSLILVASESQQIMNDFQNLVIAGKDATVEQIFKKLSLLQPLKKMIKKNYFSEDFVFSSGSVLFNLEKKEICLVSKSKSNGSKEYLLPKGRKDVDETLADTAMRETHEETGYPCKLLRLKMPTRATKEGDLKDEVRHYEAAECFVVSTRHTAKAGHKMIFWYISEVQGDKQEGTQMENESFQSVFLPYKRALELITFSDEKEILEKAITLVEQKSS